MLRDLLEGLPATWAAGRDTLEGWRPRDVVGHLISAELEDWIPRARLILDHGTARPFPPFDRFAMLERDADVPLNDLLMRFEQLRAKSLAELDAEITPDVLDRTGRHPTLGEVTLRQLLATWAVHDLDHTAQVYAGMSAAYDEEVGPWKAYLGILLRREDPSAVPG